MTHAPGLYADRDEAGRRLATELHSLVSADDRLVVTASSLGGVAVGSPVSESFEAPLEFLLVEALRAPGRPELAVGAVADAGEPHQLVDLEMAAQLGFGTREIRARVSHHLWEFRRHRNRLHALRSLSALSGRTVVLVDDGAAPLACVRLAIRVARSADPARIVVALPAATEPVRERLAREADALCCPVTVADHPTAERLYAEHVPIAGSEAGALIERSHRRIARRRRCG